MKKIALENVALGIPVIPIQEGQKKPPLVCNGTKDTTTNPEIVEQWWSQWPQANVGVVASPEGILIVDDDEDVIAKAPLEINLEINTRVVESSPGHKQYYFKQTDGTRKIGNLVQRGGFSLRSARYYGLAAGSLHPDGHRYKLAVDQPIQERPVMLLSYLKDRHDEAQRRLYGTDDIRERSNFKLGALPGGKLTEGMGRNDDMAAIAGKLWDGRKDFNQMVSEVTREIELRHDPPYPQDRVEELCARVVGESGEAWKPNLEKAAYLERPKFTGGKAPRPEGKAKFYEFVLAPGENQTEGCFPKMEISLVAGASGAGKSTWALRMLADQLEGKKVHGRASYKRPVCGLMLDRSEGDLVRTL